MDQIHKKWNVLHNKCLIELDQWIDYIVDFVNDKNNIPFDVYDNICNYKKMFLKIIDEVYKLNQSITNQQYIYYYENELQLKIKILDEIIAILFNDDDNNNDNINRDENYWISQRAIWESQPFLNEIK